MTYLLGISAIALLVYAALHDVAARTVPNWLPVVILVIGVAARLADHTLEAGLLIAAITFTILFCIWVLGVMGGGDVKLWAATALLIPPQLQPEIDFYFRVFLLGGLLGLIYLALFAVMRRWQPAPAAGRLRSGAGRRGAGLVRRVLRAEAWRISRKGPLPYACAISAGAILTLLPASLQL